MNRRGVFIFRQVLDCAGPPALFHSPSKTRRRAAIASRQAETSVLHESLKQIKDCGLNIGSGKVSIQKIRREDWAESWKRHFKPIEIGAALLIKPSWSKRPPRKNQAVIVLDPGLSFGTGQHPTTSFCLQQLVSRYARFKKQSLVRSPPFVIRYSSFSFLDIGTGSGILAIAAAKLGYAPVDGFDFDPEAVRIARENARKNRVLRKVHITGGDVTKLTLRRHKQYDLICANLISTLLVAERSRILCRLKDNGVLVLAGILKIEFASVQRAYEDAGMRLIASRAEKEWRSGAFTYQRQR
jgi:ribosomal protein L11 methyltransferase